MKALQAELNTLLARFERRHKVTLSGHLRVGSLPLWYHHNPEQGDLSALAALCQSLDTIQKQQEQHVNTSGTGEPPTGDSPGN